ncbi:MAG: hypothetical protein KGO05_06280, partial [Chloroflexota bacterium]|nr:hypothetical protein [Chloroflexota bacterium]
VNCQVALMVPDAEEAPPEWPTGRELAVGNSGAIYVSTICDVDGEVTHWLLLWQERRDSGAEGDDLATQRAAS